MTRTSLFRYRAVAIAGAGVIGPKGRRTVAVGELSGETPAEVRARLRAGGFLVVELAPVRRLALPKLRIFEGIARLVEAHLRARRHAVKEEVCDGLATLLDAGVPLTEALETLLRGEAARQRSLREMLVVVRDQVRAGGSLAAAVGAHRGWFDPVEVALLEAGEHVGSLAQTLKSLAARQARKSQVGQKLAAALLYPGVVATVGVGVWIFLSTKTLPELARILKDGEVEVPALTRAVMASGGFVARHGASLALALAIAAAAVAMLAPRVGWRAARRSMAAVRPPRSLFGFAALRRLRLARIATGLADLLQGGVPLVEGLRTVAPTAGSRSLRASLEQSALAIEQGKAWSETLADEAWYPAEFRRLVETGETSGELKPMLARLGERMERSAQRRIERLAALLEPAAILALAALIGVVVAAAVLPITRLQGLV